MRAENASLLASILHAACEGQVDEVEALVVSNSIDVNAPLFEVHAPWLWFDDHDRKDAQPLLHAWLYHCFVLRNNEDSPPLLDSETRYAMMTMMVKKLGANLAMNRARVKTDLCSNESCSDDSLLYLRPCSCDMHFNAMDFVWFRCLQNRWFGHGEEKDEEDTESILATVAQLEELQPGYTPLWRNFSILLALCASFSNGLVRKLHGIGFGSEGGKSLSYGFLNCMFSPRRWKEYGWLFLKRCDCEGTIRFIIRRMDGWSERKYLHYCCGRDSTVGRLIKLYSGVVANDPSRDRIPAMIELLMTEDMPKYRRELTEFAFGAPSNDAQRIVQTLVPVTDAFKRLAIRADAIEQDNMERHKMGMFFKQTEWGKALGRDIVQNHILPRVIVLGGKDQARMDRILDSHRIPTEVRECAFYYRCLLSRVRGNPAIVGEFRFMQFLMSPEGKQECEEVMRRSQNCFAGYYDGARIADIVLGALRASFNSQKGAAVCLLGASAACPDALV